MNQKAGVRSATMFWPGSEVAIARVRPPDWMRYDAHVGYAQRVNALLHLQALFVQAAQFGRGGLQHIAPFRQRRLFALLGIQRRMQLLLQHAVGDSGKLHA